MRWVGWMLFSMFLVMVAVIVWPELALWLPRYLGYWSLAYSLFFYRRTQA